MKRKSKFKSALIPTKIRSQAEMQGRFIRNLRVFNKLSQKELANTVGCSQSLISRIENAKYNPKTELLQKLYNTLSTYTRQL